MPRQDGTGPEGQGPGTGRGQGPCNIPKKDPRDKSNNPFRFKDRPRRRRQGWNQ